MGSGRKPEQIVRDDLIIYEIMIEKLEEEWWRGYREILESRFQQQSLVRESSPDSPTVSSMPVLRLGTRRSAHVQ